MSDITEVETIRISPRAAWNKIKALKAENASLRTALTDLYACQNGPPLIRDTEKWNAAMKRTAEVLPEF